MSALSFSYSCSEGKSFELRCVELENVAQIQISTKPHKNNRGKRYKACTVVDGLNEGKQYNYPKGPIESPSKIGVGLSQSLFDRNGVSWIFSLPCEPHGCMAFDNQSVKHTDSYKPDETCTG